MATSSRHTKIYDIPSGENDIEDTDGTNDMSTARRSRSHRVIPGSDSDDQNTDINGNDDICNATAASRGSTFAIQGGKSSRTSSPAIVMPSRNNLGRRDLEFRRNASQYKSFFDVLQSSKQSFQLSQAALEHRSDEKMPWQRLQSERIRLQAIQSECESIRGQMSRSLDQTRAETDIVRKIAEDIEKIGTGLQALPEIPEDMATGIIQLNTIVMSHNGWTSLSAKVRDVISKQNSSANTGPATSKDSGLGPLADASLNMSASQVAVEVREQAYYRQKYLDAENIRQDMEMELLEARDQIKVLESRLERRDAGERELNGAAEEYIIEGWLNATIGQLGAGQWKNFVGAFFRRRIPLLMDTSIKLLWVKTPWTCDYRETGSMAMSLEERSARLFWLLHQDRWTPSRSAEAIDHLYIISDCIVKRGVDSTGLRNVFPTLADLLCSKLRGHPYLHDFAVLQLVQLSRYISGYGSGHGSSDMTMDMMIGPQQSLPRRLGSLVDTRGHYQSDGLRSAVDDESLCHIAGRHGYYRDSDVEKYWVMIDFTDKSVRVIERTMASQCDWMGVRVGSRLTTEATVQSPDSHRWNDIVVHDMSTELRMWWDVCIADIDWDEVLNNLEIPVPEGMTMEELEAEAELLFGSL